MKTEQLEITNEDNMILMSRYPDNHFDLAIVDPPYGINAGKMTMGSGKHKFSKDKDWDEGIPSKEYFDELFRVSKNQIIWGANYFTEYLQTSPHWLIWDKKNPNLSFAEGEMAWVRNGKNLRIFQHYSARPDEVTGKIHPTQKPFKLYEWIFKNYANCKFCGNEGSTYEDVAGDGGSRMKIHCEDCGCGDDDGRYKILDTHLGSGSIAIALDRINKFDKMNLHLTACELDKDYFDAACDRIEKQTRQQTLF